MIDLDVADVVVDDFGGGFGEESSVHDGALGGDFEGCGEAVEPPPDEETDAPHCDGREEGDVGVAVVSEFGPEETDDCGEDDEDGE